MSLKIAACFILSIFSLESKAQEALGTNDSIHKKYPFIKTEQNIVQGDTASLIPFYQKLYLLQQDSAITVRVVHIGDSHLQADHFPAMVRQKLQKKFGNAGRGLVAPFKLGRTNEPTNYKSTSNTPWKARRIVNEKDSMPIGISGLTVKNDAASSYLSMHTYNADGLDYSFSKITLFHQKGMGTYNFNVCDSLFCFQTAINSQNDSLNEYSVVHVPLSNTVIFSFDTIDTLSKKTALIYGMLLENEKPGMLYSTIGINGAEYRHYNRNPKFQHQLKVLQPDLIIISLGTNEAYAAKYNSNDFYKEIDTLITNLKTQNPGAQFLLTTPGDSYRKRKYKNPNNLKATRTVINYSNDHYLAYWDWYHIMGGMGSINKWFVKGLTSKDKLHLNRKGYEVQGNLLYQALYMSYMNYLNVLHTKP